VARRASPGRADVHELSIALSLIELAAEKAAEAGGGRIEAVHLRLGRLAGVAKDALAFSFDLASQGTRLEGARLVIEEAPVVVFCPECKVERPADETEGLRCPVCGCLARNVTGGRELELTALEVSEDVPAHR
jgi:hydrogenase nickel incorporation protein HypA/HybF